MNKFFYNFSIVLLSVLGIGFITRFRGVLIHIFSILIVLSIPDGKRPEILGIVILINLMFFAYFYDEITANVDKNVLVFRHSTGIWLAAISPYVFINWFWALVLLLLYLIIKKTFEKLNKKIFKCKSSKCEFLKQDLMTGLVTLVLLQIIYSAATVLPFVWIYYFE
jgi:hypothetical protein